ncbi:MAG TPA: hypothetical protein VJP76_00045 [Candidatus Tumulicola sp.]|nr:hypothetical protein [Candidatus Tumulicola sp.]
MIHPRPIAAPVRLKNPRTARAATQRRIVHKSRARYSSVARLGLGILALLIFFMSYVVLTSSLTGTSYALSRAHDRREALLEETMRLDDRIAALRSDDRLSSIAAKLGMRDPQRVALVKLNVPHAVDRTHVAVLSSLAGFFLAPPAHRR